MDEITITQPNYEDGPDGKRCIACPRYCLITIYANTGTNPNDLIVEKENLPEDCPLIEQ